MSRRNTPDSSDSESLSGGDDDDIDEKKHISSEAQLLLKQLTSEPPPNTIAKSDTMTQKIVAAGDLQTVSSDKGHEAPSSRNININGEVEVGKAQRRE